MLRASLPRMTALLLLLVAMMVSMPSSPSSLPFADAQPIMNLTSAAVSTFSLAPGSSAYYRVNCDTQGWTIAVVVTALLGEPDMYWSSTTWYPSPTNNQGSSTQDGSDVFSIPNCQVGSYYVAVVSSDLYAATYTIQAQVYSPLAPQNNPRTLLTTSPQNDVLGRITWRYFSLQLTAPSSMLNLYLSSRVGDPDLYVTYSATNNIGTTYPTTTRYNWSSTAWGSDLLAIRNAAAGYYFIGIYAFTDVAYQLSAAVAEQPLAMLDGYTYGREVDQGTYVYYTFNVTASSTALDLFFITTAMSGDPDLYISRTNTRPNQTSYDWRSISGSAVDVVVLYGALGEVQAGTYYVGVYGWSTARFTIMASLQARAILTSGVAAAGQLAANGNRIYQLDVPISATVSWSVTSVATYGYTMLYLGQNPRIDPDDATTFTYTSTWLSATTQNIGVPGGYCVTRISNTTNACRMYILARAPNQPSGYQLIAASSSSYVTLLPSQPTPLTTVPVSQYRFYQFNVALLYANVTVQVTPSSGNPDLFIGRTRPITAGNAMFQSTAVGADRVTFWWNDPRLQGQSITGTWFVAIYGTSAATFSVLVTVNDSSAAVRPVALPIGTPLRAVVALQATNVYRVILTRTNNVFPTLYVSLTPVSGDPDLTIINEYTGASIASALSGQDIITILPTSPVACPNTNATCPFSVRVYGWSRSDYLITASTTGSVSLVSNRVATTASVGARAWIYYMFINPSASSNSQMELALSLTQQFGNPDLYVSSTFPPSLTNYNWSSANAIGGDFVTISPVSLPYYYIGVYANSATLATFSLYSDLYNKSAPELSAVTLSLGTPLQGATSVRNFRYYTFTLNVLPMPRYLLISLVALVGDPDLYVTTTQLDGQVWPSLTRYRWSSTYGGSDYLYIANPNATTYRIGVYAWSTSLYQLAVSTASARPLSDGVQLASVATAASPVYFSFLVGQLSANASLTFSITPTSGNPDLFVSRSLSELEAGRSTWNSTQSTGFDIVRINSRVVQAGTYYVKVASAAGSSSFAILASYASAITLVDGLPVTSYVSTSASQYYRITYQGPLAYDVVITVTPLYGVPFLYATTRADVEPSPAVYDYRDESIVSTTHSVTIPKSRCSSATLCTFNVLVLGSQSSYYTISSATAGTYTLLSQGIVQSGTLATATASFYRFTVSDPYSNVTVTLNAQSGNPDLYVSSQQPVGPSSYQWSSANASTFGIDVVYFDWTAWQLTNPMTTYTFYVAVYARVQSTFTLRLKVDSSSALVRTQLPANQNVGGSVRQGGQDLFAFTATAAYVASPLRFALFTATGNADLTVSCPSTGGSWTSSASGTFADVVTIYPDDAKACKNPTNQNPCVYYVDVKGTQASTYSLQAQVLDLETRVRDIAPYVEREHTAGTWRYYVYSDVVLPSNGKQLSFVVTPYAGNPDMYVSMVQRPSKSVYNWSSTQVTEEYIAVGAPTAQSYWIAIYAEGTVTAVYSLMVEYYDPSNPQGSALTLSQWGSQNGRLAANQWRYYVLSPLSPFTHLSFAAISSSGNPDVYVSSSVLSGTAFPTVAKSDWSSVKDGNDVLIVPTTSDAVYRVGVFGETAAFYTLVAAASTVLPLPSTGSSLKVLSVRENTDSTYSSYMVDVIGGSFSITVRANSEVMLTISQESVFPLPNSMLSVATKVISGGQTDSVTLDNLKSGPLFITLLTWRGEGAGATLVSTDQSASSSSSGTSSVNGGAIAAGILVPLVVIALAVVVYRYYQANGHLPFLGSSRSSGSLDGHMEMNPRSNAFNRGGGMPSSRLLDDDHADSGSSGSEGSYRPPTRS